jgi:hypothetical protein
MEELEAVHLQRRLVVTRLDPQVHDGPDSLPPRELLRRVHREAPADRQSLVDPVEIESRTHGRSTTYTSARGGGAPGVVCTAADRRHGRRAGNTARAAGVKP